MTTPSNEPASDGGASPAAAAASAARVRLRLVLHFGVVLLVAGAGGALLGGAAMAVSALMGVVLAGANLLFMRRITSALTCGGGAGWVVL